MSGKSDVQGATACVAEAPENSWAGTSNLAVIVPIYWPGTGWGPFVRALAGQTLRPRVTLIVSSGATQEDLETATNQGWTVHRIDPSLFDHGGTRQLAVEKLPDDIDVAVFLTQDAILSTNDSLATIARSFADPAVGAAWGRQLPHADASPVARHARTFNYPVNARSVTYDDRQTLGIKAAFCSNSFAAYRLSALRQVGGFPVRNVHGEDMHVAARMLKANWKVSYAAGASVYHSHNYSLREEFARYFDTGAFHADNPWLLADFGMPGGEGRRFVASEFSYLLRESPLSIPSALVGTLGKLIGYKLGRRYQALPRALPLRLGMNKAHWKRNSG